MVVCTEIHCFLYKPSASFGYYVYDHPIVCLFCRKIRNFTSSLN